MGIRKRKPTSPGRRFQTVSDFSELTRSAPEKSLLAKKSKTGGRNSYGRKTSRHRGGGVEGPLQRHLCGRHPGGGPAAVVRRLGPRGGGG